MTLADIHVDSSDVFLHHKTTRRELFEEQKAKHQDCYDVIFLNERGELTEGSYNTIVLQLDGQLLTPTRECGLLPGVLRSEMLDAGILHEAVLTVDDLRRAERLWLINSVRGWRECVLEPQ